MTELAAALEEMSEARMNRALSLLQTLLIESETKGTYGQRAHGARLRGPPVKLVIVNRIRNCPLPAGKSDMVFHGNSTVWDVRRQLGQRTGMSAEKVCAGLVRVECVAGCGLTIVSRRCRRSGFSGRADPSSWNATTLAPSPSLASRTPTATLYTTQIADAFTA